MRELSRKIQPINIEEELKRSYLDYAMSVIIGRALPDVRDGLKPVHRRILFAMHVLKNDWNKPYKKTARIVGDVIGKYHPHGDSAVYDAIVRMAQSFSLRYMLVDGQGNFGSVDGDSAAAMRYTEVRMSKIANELLIDLEKNTVNYVSNYDDTESIPDVMPTRIPNLLLNGSSGIAVGMATNIPPHNLSEIINGCLAYIHDDSISIENLMKHITGPDFPTGAIINGKLGIENAYRTGRGKIDIRARAKVEINTKTGRESIIVHEIPYQVNKSRLIEKISSLVKENRIEGINSNGLRDESDKDGMRIVIEIKRDAVGTIVLNNLYASTQLQISFSINMVALHQGKPKTLSLKDIIAAFIHHRKEVVIRRTNFELSNARDRVHILEGLSIALNNIDVIIVLLRKSSTSSEAKVKLMKYPWKTNTLFYIRKHEYINMMHSEHITPKLKKCEDKYILTEKQAQAILDLRLQKLTGLEHEKLLQEYRDLLSKISKLIKIIQDPSCLMWVIQEELSLIKEQYHDARRTEITNIISEIHNEDLIDQKDILITLSNQGYIKYQPLTNYETQHRGGKGRSAAYLKKEDFISRLVIANTHDNILLFSNRGRVYWLKAYQLPEASRSSRGRPIVNLLPLKLNEYITTILPIRTYEKGRYVFMATINGIVKKTKLTEFSRPRSSGIIAVTLNEFDKLIDVNLTDGSNEIMLFSSYGKVVRFQESQVRNMGRTATGVRGMILSKGDHVISLVVPQSSGTILTVTQYGYGKCTDQEEYPTKSRATRGVISIKVNTRNGKVIGAIQVKNCDQIIMITDAGTLVRTKVSEVSIIGRNTQGIILLRTKEKEHVVGLQKISESLKIYHAFI